ncbi:MAG: RtcB family protein [Patescibacteria group bacterium]
MLTNQNFKKITDYIWEISKSFRKDMKVPGRIYAAESMLESIEDEAIGQVINVATLPGIVNYSLAMPDIHVGYGFVVGGVAAMEYPKGIISPGGVGYDISCGIRILKSNFIQKEIQPQLDRIAMEIQKEIPSGLGKGRKTKFSITEINKILEGGAKYLFKNGYGEKEDLENCESNGYLSEANASYVSDQAKQRGRDQVGTLGSGNHFCEVQKVDEIFDTEVAKIFGLFRDQIVIMVHCGSRGLGHQVATDYIRLMMSAMQKYGISLPDRELACTPFNSDEGQKYFKAMCAAANYAWANRQMITHYIRKAWEKIFKNEKLTLLYDVSHNIAKVEKYNGKKLIVHRKGATRAFGPGRPEIPEKYRKVGQPVLIPGSMGTASYVLVGTKQAEKETFGSTCHGSGRIMSRKRAKKTFWGSTLRAQLEKQGIIIRCESNAGLSEEAPGAYKNVEDVVEVVHQAGISKKVARLKPLVVIKGE